MKNKSLKIVNWINNYCIENKFNTLVIGISGGIDSALTSTLCAMTGLNVIVVSLPLNQNFNELKRAHDHIDWLKQNFSNVSSLEIDLSNSFINFVSNFKFESTKLSLANCKSRLRMVSLYHIASNYNGLVVGTGNKIEDFGVGFFTKYGDGGVDISPIADLLKSEVFEMAQYLGVIDDILLAAPTDGLWEDGRTDEDQLKLTYDQLEWAMNFKGIYENLTDEEKYIFNRFKYLNKIAQHKINSIPVCKLELN